MRLIDADKLMKAMYHRAFETDGDTMWQSGCWVRYRAIEQVVKEQPTVKTEPRWIPCSERLPEEKDYNSCMECLDGAVWCFTENGAMGLGYYYESTKEWSTTDDLKTDGKVVAWMTLPEPYMEEDE